MTTPKFMEIGLITPEAKTIEVTLDTGSRLTLEFSRVNEAGWREYWYEDRFSPYYHAYLKGSTLMLGTEDNPVQRKEDGSYSFHSLIELQAAVCYRPMEWSQQENKLIPVEK